MHLAFTASIDWPKAQFHGLDASCDPKISIVPERNSRLGTKHAGLAEEKLPIREYASNLGALAVIRPSPPDGGFWILSRRSRTDTLEAFCSKVLSLSSIRARLFFILRKSRTANMLQPLLIPLILSSVVRQKLEDKLTLNLVEAAIQFILIEWITVNVWACLATFAVFLAIEFVQTQAEYANVRNTWEQGGKQPLENTRRGSVGVWALTPPTHSPHGKATMFPCTLRHIRRSAFKDSFSHSYLYVGVPVDLGATFAPLLSVGKSSWKTWFSIRPQDQALRGGGDLSLEQKLEEYLVTHNEHPSQWTHAYFLTAPCVNGQSDNPLAFWYLYDSDRRLDAIVVQLDTSYGERRMWLVRNAMDEKSAGGPYCFRGSFIKDLQVSPFMPVDPTTTYVLDSSDPCQDEPLRILVTLKQGANTLMVTSVAPRAAPLDLATSTTTTRVKFLLSWWWIPIATVVTWRILSQAARIYLANKDKIALAKRTEPIKTAIGKPARTVEKYLEKDFFLILEAMVKTQSHVRSVKYISPGEHAPRERIVYSAWSKFRDGNDLFNPLRSTAKLPDVTFQVLTPTFYSRFFHYSSPSAAIKAELLADPRARTAWCSDPEIFAAMVSKPLTISPVPMDWRWRVVCLVRCQPTETNYASETLWERFDGLSVSDQFVVARCTEQQHREYRRALLRLYLGEWMGGMFFGHHYGDLEQIGLSRDAVIRIHEATFKTFLALLVAASAKASGHDNLAVLAHTALDVWACLKEVI